MRKLTLSAGLLLAFTLVPAGAAQGHPRGVDRPSENVQVPPGYSLVEVAGGLDFPTGIAIGEDRLWVSEAGIPPVGTPKIKQIDRDGNVTVLLTPADLPAGMLVPPLIDVTHHDGWLWITHRQMGVNGWRVGAISKFRPEDPVASFTTVLTNLPSSGDHFTEEIVFGNDGRAYFTQGSATNSTVVGLDNALITGWLGSFPAFHDFAPVDVTLSGSEYTTLNPLTDDPDDMATTSPYQPFGVTAPDGAVVQAATPSSPQEGIVIGNGAAYSFDPESSSPASTLRLETWGLRNPFGIGIDPFNPDRIFISNNGADVRTAKGPEVLEPVTDVAPGELVPVGSRPIENDFDDLFVVSPGGKTEFVGWPDYFHDPASGKVLPITDPLFCQSPLLPAGCSHEFAFATAFRDSLDVSDAFAQLEVHSSANKFDFSTSDRFGDVGDVFVAETGSFVPTTGALRFTGYKVVRVDGTTGAVSDFIVNTGDTVEEVFDPNGFNKPIDVKFRGDTMLIVDFGVFEPGLGKMQPGTGKVWMVSVAPITDLPATGSDTTNLALAAIAFVGLGAIAMRLSRRIS